MYLFQLCRQTKPVVRELLRKQLHCLKLVPFVQPHWDLSYACTGSGRKWRHLVAFFSSPNALISLYGSIWILLAIKAILSFALKKIIVLSELQWLSFAEAEIDWDRKRVFSPHSRRTQFSIFWTVMGLGFVLLICFLHLQELPNKLKVTIQNKIGLLTF